MKKLFLLLALGFASTLMSAEAEARSCEFEMQTRRGKVIERFFGNGYDNYEACRSARQQCNRALERRQRRGKNPQASCVKVRDGRGGGYNPPRDNNRCTATLYNRRGRVISTYTAYGTRGRNACESARVQCEDERRRLNRYGDYPGSYCRTERDGRGGGYNPPRNPPRRDVSRTCQFGKFNRRGDCLASFTGYATARNSSEAKQRACNDARRQCERSTVRRQYCREI